LAALTWQVVSWVWAGPRIRVTSFSGIVAGQPQHPEALFLVASNRGRMPATIDQWGFIIKGSLHGVAAWMSSPEVPHRLEPYTQVRWQQDFRETRVMLTQGYPTARRHWDLVPYVRVGDQWSYGRAVLRVWEEGQFGPDPRISKFWRRFLPRAIRGQTRHGTGWIREPRIPGQ
jgi:hypothetical protein